MEEAGSAHVASPLADEARAFGAAQYPAAHGQWPEVAEIIGHIAELERELIENV